MVRVSELPALKMREISAQSQSVGRVQERSDCEKLEDKTDRVRGFQTYSRDLIWLFLLYLWVLASSKLSVNVWRGGIGGKDYLRNKKSMVLSETDFVFWISDSCMKAFSTHFSLKYWQVRNHILYTPWISTLDFNKFLSLKPSFSHSMVSSQLLILSVLSRLKPERTDTKSLVHA